MYELLLPPLPTAFDFWFQVMSDQIVKLSITFVVCWWAWECNEDQRIRVPVIRSRKIIFLCWGSVSPVVKESSAENKIIRPWHLLVQDLHSLFGSSWHLGSTWGGGREFRWFWGAAVAEQLGSVREYLSLRSTLSPVVRTVRSPSSAWIRCPPWLSNNALLNRVEVVSYARAVHADVLLGWLFLNHKLLWVIEFKQARHLWTVSSAIIFQGPNTV